jgi:hypothetical protein
MSSSRPITCEDLASGHVQLGVASYSEGTGADRGARLALPAHDAPFATIARVGEDGRNPTPTAHAAEERRAAIEALERELIFEAKARARAAKERAVPPRCAFSGAALRECGSAARRGRHRRAVRRRRGPARCSLRGRRGETGSGRRRRRYGSARRCWRRRRGSAKLTWRRRFARGGRSWRPPPRRARPHGASRPRQRPPRCSAASRAASARCATPRSWRRRARHVPCGS